MKRFRTARGPVLVFAILATAGLSAWPQCEPSVAAEDFSYRFGIADQVESDRDLLTLLESPAAISVIAERASGENDARVVVTTEVHALYPVEPLAMLGVLRDDTTLADHVPSLARIETVCRSGSGLAKQFQRNEFDVLFLTVGVEIMLDVHYALDGPVEYGNYWGMYESLDGRLAFQYGSWYFRSTQIDGRTYTYVRHYTTNGVKIGLPGFAFFVERSAVSSVSHMLDALYREAVRRHGTTPAASVPRTGD